MPGRNLRTIRERRYLTQIGLQIRTGINQSAISQYENGLCLPTIQNLSILANYFHVSTDYLLDRTDVEEPYPCGDGHGGNLRRIREKRHLTQIGVQMRVGINQSAISQYETGGELPTIQNIILLADLFHVSTDFLLDRTDVEEPYPPKKQ